jgi:HEAT repeat protein
MSDSFSRSIRAQLRSVDEDIRHAALTQLHENLDRIEIEASELHPLLEDEDASFRWLTVQVLAELGEVESIPALLAATADRESDVAESAREALREFRTRDAIDAFLAGLDHPQAAVRAASVEALGRLKNTRALPGLRRAAEDLSDAVRREAIVALSQFQDARTLSQLRWGLYDHSAAVRQAAVTAIATVGPLTTANPSALAETGRDLSRLLRDADAGVRREAARALAHFPSPDTLAPLLETLRDPSTEVIAATTTTLGRLRAAVAPSILPLLRHRASEVRFAAARALGEIADPSVEPALLQVLDDADPGVARAAERTLRRLAAPQSDLSVAA